MLGTRPKSQLNFGVGKTIKLKSMKKYILPFVIFLVAISITSCSSNNDDDLPSLVGTHWIKSSDNSRHFTFTTENEYVYVENGSSYPGTYTFNGTEGVFTETSSGFQGDFKVVGDVLTSYQDVNDPTSGVNYIKQ